MTSTQSYLKQQNILYAALPGITEIQLNVFVRDPYAPSNPGAEYGHFVRETVALVGQESTSSLTVFRDMGQPIVSAGRTFRRIQQLIPKLPAQLGQDTQPNTFGVAGFPSVNSAVTDYLTFYYENSIESGGCEYVNELFRIR